MGEHWIFWVGPFTGAAPSYFLPRLELCILDFMAKRGCYQSSEVFTRELLDNPNPAAINSPEGFLLHWWGKFYEAFKSRFPGVTPLSAQSFDKVAQTVDNVVSDISQGNPTYASNHTVMASSFMMPPPHLNGPDLMDPNISDLLSSFDTSMVPDLSPQVDMTSSLQFLKMSEMDEMLLSANNSRHLIGQIPEVPPQWEATDDMHGINFGSSMQMHNLYAAANALPPLPEPSDAGNDRSLHPTSHQGWSLVGVGSVPPAISHQIVSPEVAVQTFDTLKYPAPASSGDFSHKLIQAKSSGKNAGMLGDTSERRAENLRVDQQLIAPIGGIQRMRVSRKQTAVQEQTNQLGLQKSTIVEHLQSGRKRKASLSSLAAVGKDNNGSYFTLGRDDDLNSASSSRTTLRKSFATPRTQEERKGLSVEEIGSLHASRSKLLCCHFHSQGKFVATAGQEKKVVIWDLANNSVNSGEGHGHIITDVRFRPNSTVFATSSFDRTVMLWDAAKPSIPFQNLVGHTEHVMSADFHPKKMDLLTSCDSYDQIRLWDVNKGNCRLILKGGSRQVRFQPPLGNLLASSTGNIINIFDVETNSIRQKLQGHVRDVRSICWDMSGELLATVSEDSARIWSVKEGKCMHELCSGGNKFQSCTFHSGYGQLLVIGSYGLIEMWNPFIESNRTWPHRIHDGVVSSLADLTEKRIIASVSHDQWIKIWQ